MTIRRNIKLIIIILAALACQASSIIAYHGAGILPYAINPQNKKVYFLFSQEAFGNSKGTWSDFGGGAEPKDRNNPINTASRECFEESIGLVGNYKQIQNRLLNHGKGIFSFNKPYTMYLMKIPFDKNINKKFKFARSKAKLFQYKEKLNLIWVEKNSLRNALIQKRNVMVLQNGQRVVIKSCTFKMLRNNVLKVLNRVR